jgi:hypothetical protein
MKTTGFLAALVLGISGTVSFAQNGYEVRHSKMSFSFWGGYTNANMGDVNDYLRATLPGSVTEIGNGFLLNAEYLYEPLSRLAVGTRLGYVGLNEGKGTSATFSSYRQDLYLVPILAGGRYAFYERGDWKLTAGVFLGVGLGYGRTRSALAAAPTAEIETEYDGTDFVGDLLLGGQYRIARAVSLGIDVGYRHANIATMNVSGTGTSSGSGGGGGLYGPARAPVTGSAGNTLAFDFSGIIAAVGLIFAF